MAETSPSPAQRADARERLVAEFGSAAAQDIRQLTEDEQMAGRIGRRLRDARLAKGLSLKEVSERSGISVERLILAEEGSEEMWTEFL